MVVARIMVAAKWFKTKFWLFFSSAKWFGMEFKAFWEWFERNHEVPSVFLFYEMVRNRIPSILSSAEWFGAELRSSECFSLLCTCTKWFVTEFRAFTSSREWLGKKFRAFPISWNRQNSDGVNQNFYIFCVPRKEICSENGNPTLLPPSSNLAIIVLKQTGSRLMGPPEE